jgi:hypothetical protein
MSNQQIEIFISADGQAQLKVALDSDTVWLTQAQMAELFAKDVRTINEHLGNLYREEELNREATIRKSRIVRQEGNREVTREIEHYNLDVIISVGYRVKSQRGVQFRQWATRVLKQHLVEGYSINQKRLAERGIEFEQAIALLSKTLANQQWVAPTGVAVLNVISEYARSWSLLQGYDEQSLIDIAQLQQGKRVFQNDITAQLTVNNNKDTGRSLWPC